MHPLVIFTKLGSFLIVRRCKTTKLVSESGIVSRQERVTFLTFELTFRRWRGPTLLYNANRAQGVKVTTHLHLAPGLGIYGGIPPRSIWFHDMY
jgi:hypothetical protein